MTARTPRTPRSRRLALIAGVALALATPSVVGAGTDATPPTTAPDATAAPGGKTAAPSPTASADATATSVAGSTPEAGAAAIEPLAVIDIAATGPGIAAGTAVDGQTALDTIGVPNMPIVAGATVAEYEVSFSAGFTAEDEPYLDGNTRLLATAASDMASADIHAAFQSAIETLGAFDVSTSSSTSDGTTTDWLTLDAADAADTPATSAPAAAVAPVAMSSLRPRQYEIAVSRNETEQPGVVLIEVAQYFESVDGVTAPAMPDAIAAEYAEPTAFAAANGWTLLDWHYSDGVNMFSGAPIKMLRAGFDAGTGAATDLAAVGDVILAEFGTPSYESVEDDSFNYTFDSGAGWNGSFRDYWPGHELFVGWSFTA